LKDVDVNFSFSKKAYLEIQECVMQLGDMSKEGRENRLYDLRLMPK